MSRVDAILFSNVTTAVQRTANLSGGAVRGLPGGAVVGGLEGLQSLGAELADAQKEFRKGRLTSALQRVRQIEMQFNGAKGRWNAMVGSLLTAARSGKQNLPMQKLNELKNAQAKMMQITGPANKTLKDLIYALDLAVSVQGDMSEAKTADESRPSDDDLGSQQASDAEGVAENANESRERESEPAKLPEGFQLITRLQIIAGEDGKKRITPRLQVGECYLARLNDSQRVLRVEELDRKSVWVTNISSSQREEIPSTDLKLWLNNGMWLLKQNDS